MNTIRKEVKKEINKRVPSSSTAIILESISDGVFTVNSNWQITSFNRAAEEITGISREEAIGKRCSEVFRYLYQSIDFSMKYEIILP